MQCNLKSDKQKTLCVAEMCGNIVCVWVCLQALYIERFFELVVSIFSIKMLGVLKIYIYRTADVFLQESL